MPIQLDSYAASHQGMKRRLNEDAFVCQNASGLFLVSDGMGGENCGDVASKLAATFFENSITPYLLDEDATAAFEEASEHNFFLDAMKHAANQTNQAVLQAARDNPSCKGMGTTLTVVAVRNGSIHIAHVGDSRLYRFENGRLVQITEDHTRVHEMVKLSLISADEARMHPQRHIITQCIGRNRSFKTDLIKQPFISTATYLLCSDGLYDMLEDRDIGQILATCTGLEQAGNQLINRANQNGGRDNITVVLFRQAMN